MNSLGSEWLQSELLGFNLLPTRCCPLSMGFSCPQIEHRGHVEQEVVLFQHYLGLFFSPKKSVCSCAWEKMGSSEGSWNSNRVIVGKEEGESKDVWKRNWPEYLIGKENRKDTVNKRGSLGCKWWNYEREEPHQKVYDGNRSV